MDRADAVGHLLGRADQRIAAMAHGEAVADQGQQVVREGLGVRELRLDHAVERVGVAMRIAEMLDIILRFLRRPDDRTALRRFPRLSARCIITL